MRLLFVGTKAGSGGTEMHLVALARAMAEAGHDVGAVVRPGDVIEAALSGGSAVRLFPGRFRVASDPAGALDTWRAARALRPHWVVATFRAEYYASWAIARVCRARVALFKHNDLPMRRLTRYLLPRLPDRFIVPSWSLRAHFLRLGMPPRRVHVLPNPVDTSHFQPDEGLRQRMRRQLGFSARDFVVGFVGRIEREKGADVLAAALDRAMGQDERVRALWVGDGTWAPDLARHLERSPCAARHVRLGWIRDVREHYAAMDLLALPSIRSEAFGRASVEAQACGVPVLGSLLGGIPETMDPERTGRLVPPGDVVAWERAILVCAEPDVRRPMAARAPEFVARNFEAARIACAFEGLLASPVETAPTHKGGDKRRFFEDLHRREPEPWRYSTRAAEVLRHDRIAELVARLPRGRVLEVGCSAGTLTSRLAALDVDLYAADLSPTAVSRARRRVEGPPTGGHHPPRFLVGSATALPIQPCAFDVIIAADGLISWYLDADHRTRALRQMHDSLAAGGHVLLTEHLRPSRFKAFVAEIAESPLRIVETHYMYDWLWYEFERCLGVMPSNPAVGKLIASAPIARALARVGRLFGPAGSRHILILAQRVDCTAVSRAHDGPG